MGRAARPRGAARRRVRSKRWPGTACVVYVALGNPLYVPLITAEGRERLAASIDVDAALGCLVDIDRSMAAALDVPEHFRVGLDLTDSGPLPTTGRGYDPDALDALLDETPFHRVCADFPADPAARPPRRTSR